MVLPAHRMALFAVPVLLLLAPGCGFVPRAQYAASESQNRALSEQTRAQLAEIANLKARSRQVEDQLAMAEEELALLDEQMRNEGKHWSSLERERGDLSRQLRGRNAMPEALARRLTALSDRYPSLQFDPRTGISKLDTDVLFDTGDAALKPEATHLLDDLAEVLASPEAAQLRVMVVGHTDDRRVGKKNTRENYPSNWHLSTGRALAVAEHMKQLGVPDEQLGIAGFGEHQPIAPNTTADSRRKNRRVEIFVVGPETPVVGWTETIPSVY
ncbi:MAG: OmpA family protein [Pirellulales bacterium]|nr:OmpA family protein [Pirellulales bacterium]